MKLLLSVHSVVSVKKGAARCHELTIRGVIDGFDGRNPFSQFSRFLLNVGGELCLREPRAYDQYRARPGNGRRHLL